MGRRGRLDRGRGGDLLARRPRRADHDATRPACREPGARGCADAIGRTHRGDGAPDPRGEPMTTVAVVGTGRMGSAMARALARGGAEVVLYNRTAARCAELAKEIGARVAGSAADAAADTDVAITMLADGDAVRAVWGGADGLVAGAHDGGVLVDMSTVAPDTLAGFEASVRERGSGI